jgi:hypothetical protein
MSNGSGVMITACWWCYQKFLVSGQISCLHKSEFMPISKGNLEELLRRGPREFYNLSSDG